MNHVKLWVLVLDLTVVEDLYELLYNCISSSRQLNKTIYSIMTCIYAAIKSCLGSRREGGHFEVGKGFGLSTELR